MALGADCCYARVPLAQHSSLVAWMLSLLHQFLCCPSYVVREKEHVDLSQAYDNTCQIMSGHQLQEENGNGGEGTP